MNSVIINGRITKDPEVHYTNNTNSAYIQFSIAVRKDFKNKDGQYDTIFVDCAAFSSTAQYIGNYVHKGDMLLVKGRLGIQSYQDKDGKTRTFTNIEVEQVENLTPQRQQEQAQQQPNCNPSATAAQPQCNRSATYQQPKPQPKQEQVPNTFDVGDDDTLPWL